MGGFRSPSIALSETQMIADFGVSRPAARQALAVLAGLSQIKTRHDKGTFVTAVPDAASVTIERTARRTCTTPPAAAVAASPVV